jgi:hypothetical protein
MIRQFVKIPGNRTDFVVIDPDKSRLAGAAIPATGTAKSQSFSIPWFGH